MPRVAPYGVYALRVASFSSVVVAGCTAPVPSSTSGIITVADPCWSPNRSDHDDVEPSDTCTATVAPPNAYDRVAVRSSSRRRGRVRVGDLRRPEIRGRRGRIPRGRVGLDLRDPLPRRVIQVHALPTVARRRHEVADTSHVKSVVVRPDRPRQHPPRIVIGVRRGRRVIRVGYRVHRVRMGRVPVVVVRRPSTSRSSPGSPSPSSTRPVAEYDHRRLQRQLPRREPTRRLLGRIRRLTPDPVIDHAAASRFAPSYA